MTKTKRKTTSFKGEWYKSVISAYVAVKGVELRGSEFLPLQQACKTMFLNGREPKDIIACMEVVDSLYPDWTLNTVAMKIPDFLAGKLKSNILRVWFYDGQRAYLKGGKVYIICVDGEHREFNDSLKKLEGRTWNINRDKSDAEEQMENYMEHLVCKTSKGITELTPIIETLNEKRRSH
jgi:hypothetical protein